MSIKVFLYLILDLLGIGLIFLVGTLMRNAVGGLSESWLQCEMLILIHAICGTLCLVILFFFFLYWWSEKNGVSSRKNGENGGIKRFVSMCQYY